MRKSSKAIPAKNVDEYLDVLPAEEKAALQKLRQIIRAAVPEAEETINYQIPTYKYKGPLVHFAAFKDHCSFFVVNKNIVNRFSKELQSFNTTGTTIHFTPNKPIPA